MDACDGDEFAEIERDLFEWVWVFDGQGADWVFVGFVGGVESQASQVEDEKEDGDVGEGFEFGAFDC